MTRSAIAMLAALLVSAAAARASHPSILPPPVVPPNVLVEGIELASTPGARLRVGSALLEVTGETDPCVRMDDAKPGLFAALEKDSRGGVCCRVVEGGIVSAGDVVAWEEA